MIGTPVGIRENNYVEGEGASLIYLNTQEKAVGAGCDSLGIACDFELETKLQFGSLKAI